jgi:hypothetical protein
MFSVFTVTVTTVGLSNTLNYPATPNPLQIYYGNADRPVMSFTDTCSGAIFSADALSVNCSIDTSRYQQFQFLSFVLSNGGLMSNLGSRLVVLVPNYNLNFVGFSAPQLAAYRPGYLFLNSTPTALMATPLGGVFSGSIFNYTLYVPFITTQVIITVGVQTNVPASVYPTVTFWNGPRSAPFVSQTVVSLSSGTTNTLTLNGLTSSLTRPVSNFVNVFTPTEVLNYQFEVVVASPDIFNITVAPWPVSWINQTGISQSVIASPAYFQNPILSYTLTVTYVCTSINISVVQKTLGTIDVSELYTGTPLTILNSAVSQQVIRDPSGLVINGTNQTVTLYTTQTLTYPIQVGSNNLFIVNSLLDGLYQFSVFRAGPDVQDISVFTLDVFGIGEDQSAAYGFQNGVLPSPNIVDVPYRVQNASFLIDFNTAKTVYVSLDSQAVPTPANYDSRQQSVTTNVQTQMWQLNVGLNTFRVNSLLDGNYTVLIRRAVPDLLGMTLVANDYVGNPVPIPFPGFVRGVFSSPNYTLIIPRNAFTLNITLVYTLPYAMQLDINNDPGSILPYIPDPFNPPPDFNGVNIQIPYNLIIGANNLHLLDVYDGLYNITLIRRETDLERNMSILGFVPSTNSYAPDLQCVPALVSGQVGPAYVINVGFLIWNLTVNLTFHTPGSMIYTMNGVAQPLVSGQPAMLSQLNIGTNTFTIQSIIDGQHKHRGEETLSGVF